MTTKELRKLYQDLRFWEYVKANAKSLDARNALEMKIRGVKESIRDANREHDYGRVVKCNDDGSGYIELVFLPIDGCMNKEDVVEFFRQWRCIEPRYEAYDCTGYAFTSWFKVFRRRHQWYAYHSVCFDV